ncbi:MAG: hypothetical protein ACOZBZ_02765 [Patescibacteria group bacterium]
MKRLIKDLFNKLSLFRNGELPVSKSVEYSLNKYRKTYELLEEYDQKAIRDPEKLADPERLRPFIRRLQGE